MAMFPSLRIVGAASTLSSTPPPPTTVALGGLRDWDRIDHSFSSPTITLTFFFTGAPVPRWSVITSSILTLIGCPSRRGGDAVAFVGAVALGVDGTGRVA